MNDNRAMAMTGAGGPGKSRGENYDLGRHIRNARAARNLTLEQLAQATGLSRSYLSNVERNVNSPTISSLRVILDALNVSLTELFRTVERDRGIVTTPADRVVIARTGNGDITYELLNPNPVGKLEMLILHVAPGAGSGSEPHAHAGEEIGLMLSGELTYWVDGVTHLLKPGDSISIDATTPHRYRNAGSVPAVSVWSVTPPSF
jgi:transcriptional regulator with XRE-family HTH domain